MDSDFCQKHPWEQAMNTCRSCRFTFCGDCLVFAQGPQRPPLCMTCALALAGVRSPGANHQRLSWWEARKRRKRQPEREPSLDELYPVPDDGEPEWARLDDAKWAVDDRAEG